MMEAAPLVAVVIPYYLGSRFVRKAIESALAQTYRPLEIIVIDDGSPDSLESAIAPLQTEVRMIRQSNRGVAQSRNRGIDETHAEFIALLDQDDLWEPAKIAKQVEVFRAHPECCLVHTGSIAINATGAALQPPDWFSRRRVALGSSYLEVVRENPVLASSAVIRRSMLGAERFFDGAPGVDDWDLWLRLAAKWQFVYVDECLTMYRIHTGNFSRNAAAMLRSEITVMDRLIAREQSGPVVEIAQRNVEVALGRLARTAWKDGDALLARRLLSQQEHLNAADQLRYWTTFLPRSAFSVIAHVWRRIRAHDRAKVRRLPLP